MEITEDKYIKQWIRQRDVKKSSTRQYLVVMNKYFQYHNLTPSQLIMEAREDQTNIQWLSDRQINDRLYDFHDHLQENKVVSIKHYLSVIRNFYNHYEIQLPKMKIKNREQDQKLSTDLPGQKEIKQALENTNHKYQAIILFMASTGLSMSDVINFKITDFLTALDLLSIDEIRDLLERNDNDLIGTWQGKRFKNSILYITFNSPESTKTIAKYLLNRKWDLEETQYLFTNNWNNGKIAIRTFNGHFEAINQRCGFGYSGKHHPHHPPAG